MTARWKPTASMSAATASPRRCDAPSSLRAKRSNPDAAKRKLDCFVAIAPRKKVAQKRCHTTNIEPQTFIQGGSVPRKKVAQKRCHTTNIEPQTFIQGGSVPSTGPNSQ